MNAETGMTPGPVDADAGPLDRPFAVTLFDSHTATAKREARHSLRSLQRAVLEAAAPRKEDLPWLKLARFGDARTDKACLRHDANLLAVTGVEADYDGGVMAFEEAVERATKANLLALLYTSPSHTEDTPRWRVLCPTSQELPPDRREKLLGRLNGVFGGVFSSESWTLSQAYYFGRVRANPSHRVELVDGMAIDLLDELDAGWLGKSGPGPGASGGGAPPTTLGFRIFDEAALLAEITSGQAYHSSCVRLLGRWARDGVPYMEARARLLAAFDAVSEGQRDERWRGRRADIDRCLEDIYVKEAGRRDEGRRARPAPAAEEPWPEPVDFLADDALTGVPALRPDHLPAALHPYVVDTAARMGVDPCAVAVAALVACASVTHEDWRVQPKRHDGTWTEAARIWGAIVGDPSILKTPVIAACTRPVEALEAEARRHHAGQMERHRREAQRLKAEGGDLAELGPAPRLDRYLVEGTTVEALSEVLRDDGEARHHVPCGRVLVRQDEMSEWIASFDRYRSGGRGGGDRGAYLRLYNGGRYVVDRVGRGSFAVPSWSGCVLGGIQPEPIQRIAQEAADDGLLQRFVYCVPARQEPGLDRVPDWAAIARYERLVATLAALQPRHAPGGMMPCAEEPRRPPALTLAPEAHDHREAIDDLARALAALPDTSARLKAALGKWPGLFARLCLLFHVVEAADPDAAGGGTPTPAAVVPEPTARRVAALMREVLLPHLLRAEAVMFSTAQTGHARWIAGFVLSRGGGKVAQRDIVQAYGALRPPEKRRELQEVMESLVAMAWIRPEPSSNPTRPPATWEVNPAVHDRFAARARAEREAREAAQARIRARVRARSGGRG